MFVPSRHWDATYPRVSSIRWSNWSLILTLFSNGRNSQAATSISPFQDLLNFINLQASEASCTATKKQLQPPKKPSNRAASFATNLEASSDCVICKTTKHPLYACSEFKAMSHDGRMQVLKVNRLCTNGAGHFKSQCKSLHRCKMCQRPHHTMLHLDSPSRSDPKWSTTQEDTSVGSHTTNVQGWNHYTAGHE